MSNISGNLSSNVDSSTQTAASIVGYTIIGIVSLFGNVIISVITLQRKTGRTPIDILIFALAIGDLIITVTIPFVAVVSLNSVFAFGLAGCKLLFGVRNVAIYASSFTLVVIALERYRTTFDLSRSRRDLRQTTVLIAITWVIAIGLTIPQFIVLRLVTYPGVGIYCLEVWGNDTIVGRKAYSLVLFCLTFAIPFITVTVSNIIIFHKLFHAKGHSSTNQVRLKAKGQVVMVMVAVSAVFFICLLPIYMINTLADFQAITYTPSVVALSEIFTWIAYSHSMWNPIIYIIGSSKMRKSCKILFKIEKHETSIHYKGEQNTLSRNSLKKQNRLSSNNKIAPLIASVPADELVSVRS
ncbi:Orexin receptor type 2 [Trichoplax sp. H2]|nr:Orexin receptor type 2 [Trichoplax sp. H2]|eukprot:RDD43339.1 Orexin receptor type 2 [Trichoplax sp. H2]